MVGWSLRDAQNATGLPEIELRGGATVLVAAAEAGDSTFPPTTSRIILPGRIGNGLRNDGDVLTLLDGAGSPVDAVSWGDNRSALDPPVPAAMPGQPIRRSGDSDSDSARDWGVAAGTAAPAALLLPAPSASALAAGPGEQAQNVGITPAVPVGKGSPAAGGQAVDELVLSEIAPHAGWVELYNRGASPVDIRQWTLSDAAGMAMPMPPDVIAVPPRGFVVVQAGLDLTQEDHAVILRRPDGTIADMVTFGAVKANHSLSRFPAQGGGWFTDTPLTAGQFNLPASEPQAVEQPVPAVEQDASASIAAIKARSPSRLPAALVALVAVLAGLALIPALRKRRSSPEQGKEPGDSAVGEDLAVLDADAGDARQE